jgi:Flp pilus assembly pilin Flp
MQDWTSRTGQVVSLEGFVMRWLMEMLRRRDQERGQTLVEYALIIAFVAIALVGSLQLFAVDLQGMYQDVADAFP